MMVSNRGRAIRSMAVASAVLVLCVVPASGQKKKTKPDLPEDQKLREQWSKACDRIKAGDPWNEIAEDVELALDEALETENSAMITEYLQSIRQAEEESPFMPENRTGASQEELVALLMESVRLNTEQGRTSLIMSPLHIHGGVTKSHWESLAAAPEHVRTDPMIRILKRGREMIPHLIEALDDMTATRTVYQAGSSARRQPTVLFRRCDLAMTLLQSITRCKFFFPDKSVKWFSHHDPFFQQRVIDLVQQWRDATKELSPIEAQSWLIPKISYESAKIMIDSMIRQGDTREGIKHLRSVLFEPNRTLRNDVARRLAALGDRTGIDLLVQRLNGHPSLTEDEAGFLVRYGGRREYMLLARLVQNDLPEDVSKKNEVSRTILTALRDTDNLLAVPVLAEALKATDVVTARHRMQQKSRRVGVQDSRADEAAEHIQRLTQHDFRYSPNAEPASRIKAIERARRWWENEGRGLYGFGSTRHRRTGGIR